MDYIRRFSCFLYSIVFPVLNAQNIRTSNFASLLPSSLPFLLSISFDDLRHPRCKGWPEHSFIEFQVHFVKAVGCYFHFDNPDPLNSFGIHSGTDRRGLLWRNSSFSPFIHNFANRHTWIESCSKIQKITWKTLSKETLFFTIGIPQFLNCRLQKWVLILIFEWPVSAARSFYADIKSNPKRQIQIWHFNRGRKAGNLGWWTDAKGGVRKKFRVGKYN